MTSISGQFARGDTVSVLDRDGNEIARGLIAYSDRDATRIVGKRSAEIEALLGFRGRDEMIHRDDLVMMRADLAPAAPFFQLGLIGATIPGLAIPGAIGIQLGEINASMVATINFVILIALAVILQRPSVRQRFQNLFRRGRTRPPR